MKVIFTSETKEDFRKHNDYVRKQMKSDGHKYQSYELKGINKSFNKNLWLGNSQKQWRFIHTGIHRLLFWLYKLCNRC